MAPFGFCSLDFGFWILVWMRPQPTSFGSCIRYFHVTPTRVGGFLGNNNLDFWREFHFLEGQIGKEERHNSPLFGLKFPILQTPIY